MLLNEELDIIKLWTQPFFSSVEDLRKDYFDLLFDLGYNELNKRVAQRFGIRHTILQNIASVTTKRLQLVRATLGIADLKKKQVTREKLVTCLSKLESPLINFRSELEKILTSEQRSISVSILGAELGVDGNVMEHLIQRIAQTYVTMGVYNVDKNLLKLSFSKNEEKIIAYEKFYKKSLSCNRSANLIINLLKKVNDAETADYRGMLYRRLDIISSSYTLKFNEAKAAHTDNCDAIVKSLHSNVSYIDTLSLIDWDKLRAVNDICLDFLVEYKKTNQTKTLKKDQDDSLAARIKKNLESQKDFLFFMRMDKK
jgi:hypothetical protein